MRDMLIFSRWKEWNVLNQRRYDDPNKRRIVTRRLISVTRKDMETLLELAISQNRDIDAQIYRRKLESLPEEEETTNNNNNNPLKRPRSAVSEEGGSLKKQKTNAPVVQVDSVGDATKYHVYKEEEIYWSCTLAFADVSNNKNEYFIIQLLEANDENAVKKEEKYVILSHWGRIGFIGQFQVSTVDAASIFDPPKKAAKKGFEQLVKEKAGLDFDNIYTQDFVQGKYSALQMDYNSTDSTVLMPLGNLSIKTLEKAYQIIKKVKMLLVSSLTDDKQLQQSDIVALTNQFFSLVPHDFENSCCTLLNNAQIVSKKQALLEELARRINQTLHKA